MRCRRGNERGGSARTGFEIPNTDACRPSCAHGLDEASIKRRPAVVEPVFGILKEQRGMRKFRRRGLAAVKLVSCAANRRAAKTAAALETVKNRSPRLKHREERELRHRLLRDSTLFHFLSRHLRAGFS